MKSVSQKTQDIKILESGIEFFDDIVNEINKAEKYILIKQFLWRNDEAGRLIASALHRAAGKGVKIYIFKDRIGAFHEYGERTGQSFFHDEPKKDNLIDVHSLKSVYYQAELFFAKFYRNGVKPPEKNPEKEFLINHPNCTILDQYKLYDHSKVIIIDGVIAYIGGIGFADEFYKENIKWNDYMLKIDGENECTRLISLFSGIKIINNDKITFLNDFYFSGSGKSFHDYIVEFIGKTEYELLVQMPFLGNPDFINIITQIINKGANVKIIMPSKANSHHYRNLHFLKRLRRQINKSENLKISFTNTVPHGKILVRDFKSALLGSHNFHMDKEVLEETCVEISNKQIIADIADKFMRNFEKGKKSDENHPWHHFFIQSRLEYVSIKLQTLMRILRKDEIHRARSICREISKNILTEFHGI